MFNQLINSATQWTWLPRLSKANSKKNCRLKYIREKKIVSAMHQPFLASASAQLSYMTTEELREIFSDDDKLELRINEIVSISLW